MPQAVPAVLVDDVSKSFELPREQVHTLKERALHPFRRTGSDTLNALRGVSFSVAPGEFFGIVGRNGSGKSTMLKCLAGIYGADTGRIFINGRLSSFIELGVGFNPDLPARDNVGINATMLGLSPKEGRKRFDAIIDFAELHDFVDLKLKNYSSGMLVRLAFAVMIQVDADILLIDEVLAVGDLSFQQKCFDEFETIRRSGKTVLLVTHDMAAVQRFCDRALLLEHGRVTEEGDPARVGNRYQELNFSEEARVDAAAGTSAIEPAAGTNVPRPEGVSEDTIIVPDFGGSRYGNQNAEIIDAGFEDKTGKRRETLPVGEPCAMVFRALFHERVEDPNFELQLLNSHGDIMFLSSSGPTSGVFDVGDEAHFRIYFENVLAPDRYHLSPAVRRAPGGEWLDYRERFCSVVVTGLGLSGGLVSLRHEQAMFRVEPDGQTHVLKTTEIADNVEEGLRDRDRARDRDRDGDPDGDRDGAEQRVEPTA